MTDSASIGPIRAFHLASGVRWDRVLRVFELAGLAGPDLGPGDTPLTLAVASRLRPLDCAAFVDGVRRVVDLVGRIRHGIVS
jgi:hypothetical protein